MLYALDEKKERVEATPKQKAVCPLCNVQVISKCGEKNIWHWAHTVASSHPGKENETEWHRKWKKEFPKDWREIIIEDHRGKHIADIKTEYQMVIEFQHSSINFQTVVSRENFYDLMVWVFDVRKACEAESLIVFNGYIEWFNPIRGFGPCRKPVYLDLGKSLFYVKSIDKAYDSREIDGQDLPVWRLEGNQINRGNAISRLLAPPKHLRICCPYDKKVREIVFDACKWHRESNDPQCDKCEQFKYPFIPSYLGENY